MVGIDNLNSYYDPKLKQDRLKELEPFENFKFFKVDITDRSGMEGLWKDKGPFKKVIHLAAQAGVRYSLINPYDYVLSNCLGHLTILEMCRHTKNFEHLVYASSSSVYGNNQTLPYAVEQDVSQPVSLYAATKRSDELMSYSYSHLYGIPQTGLRFFTVYGPWGRPDMAPSIFTKSIIEEKPIQVFNHGDMKRDFTYIDDIVAGVISILERAPAKDLQAPHQILNLGNSRSENLTSFIQEIENAAGRKAIVELREMQPGDVKETYADIEVTTRLTGFKPVTTIAEGVPKFVTWYKNYHKVN